MRPVRKADNLTTFLCRCHEIWELTFLESSGPLQVYNGTALPFQIHYLDIRMVKVPVTGPVVAQRVGRGIALLFHDRGPRRGWVVSSTPRSYFTPGKDPVPIVQVAGWAPGPVWTAENLDTPEFDPRTVHPAVSRYTDWAIRPTFGYMDNYL